MNSLDYHSKYRAGFQRNGITTLLTHTPSQKAREKFLENKVFKWCNLLRQRFLFNTNYDTVLPIVFKVPILWFNDFLLGIQKRMMALGEDSDTCLKCFLSFFLLTHKNQKN